MFGHLTSYVLRFTMQECLCVLVCDDSEEVSSTAQIFLRSLFSSNKKHHVQCDFAEIFSRFMIVFLLPTKPWSEFRHLICTVLALKFAFKQVN